MGNLRGAMKSYTLPALALVTLAAAAGAQTVPVKRTSANELFSVGVNYAKATNSVEALGGPSGIDTDGYALDVRASLSGNLFLTASYADLSIDAVGAPDATTYTAGLGGKFAAGNGNIEASYAYRNVEIDAMGDTDQHLIKLGYVLELGNGLNLGLAVTEIINTEDGLDNVTAPEISVGYKFNQNISANVSFATENTLLGMPDGGNTVTVGVRYGF